MAANVESICNQALMVARRTRRIADIYEGSQESIISLELYAQARDELLDGDDWSFSRQVEPLVLLKGPPPAGGYSPANPYVPGLYPYPGFLYEYQYPADCLDVRSISTPPGPMPDTFPIPQRFRVDNDLTPNLTGGPPATGATGPPAKVIYCNATDAIATYRARITDPTQFDVGFTAALVARLAERFIAAFGENANQTELSRREAEATTEIASSLRG